MIDLRQASTEDAPACASILNDWIDATPWIPRVHTHEDVVRHYREVVLAEREVVIAHDARESSGMVAGFMALDGAFVTALYCRVTGQGIGRALLDTAKRRASEARGGLQLWTFVANSGARRFYAREGFTEVRRTSGDNEEGLPDILLEWAPA